MKRTAMADRMAERDDARNLDDDDRGRDSELLKREAESRENRIKIRREQQRKKELARKLAKRKRMFKVAGLWLGIIFIGFFVAAWFSQSLVTWIHGLGK